MISVRGSQRLLRCLRCCKRYVSSTNGTSNVQSQVQSKKSNGQLEPIVTLDLVNKIYRVPCKQSLISMMFMGQFDVRVLAYPDIINNEEELNAALNLKNNIKDHFAQTVIETSRSDVLSNLGFNNLWSMSATEGCLVFEGIGGSDYESTSLVTSKGDKYGRIDPVLMLDYNLSVVRLILHNYLSMSTIMESPNEVLKKRLENKKVAYCFTEKHSSLGVITEYDWLAQAVRKDDNTWSLTGSKSFILDDNYDEYIIFCRTTDYNQENIKYPEGSEIPPCIVTFVVPKDRVEVETFTEGGIKYQTITFPDLLLTEEEHLLLPASEDNNVMIHSKRALGQLAVSALVLGKMKKYYDKCVHFLKESKDDVKNDKIGQHTLMEFCRKIYTLESTVYLVSAMFDCFSERDMKLEGMATKIMASKFAGQMVRMVPDIIGNSNINMGPIDDCFGLWDGVLEGQLFNQLIIGLSGLRLLGPYINHYVHQANLKPFYVSAVWTESWRRFLFRRGKGPDDKKLNLSTYVNGDFTKEADSLEFYIQRLRWTVESVLGFYGRDSVSHQMHILRLGEIPIHLLAMTACMSRANRATSRVLEGLDADFLLSKLILQDSIETVQEIVSDALEKNLAQDQYRIDINRRNLKYGGYFAFSPLDKIHY